MARTKGGFGDTKTYDSPDSGEWSSVPSDFEPSGFSMGFQEGSQYGEVSESRKSVPQKVWDSFKRDPNLRTTPRGVVGANGKVFDCEAAAQATADSPLHRKLKGRHLQMIAIGGSIGMPDSCFDGVFLLTVSKVPVFLSPLAKLYRLVDLHRC